MPQAQQAGKTNGAFVMIEGLGGFTVIPSPSPLTRLHYFDGMFLRAQHFKLEQDYLRGLIALANQAGGAGVVHGFDCTLGGGDRLNLGAGLAIDPAGRVLLLPQPTSVGIGELLEKSRRLPANGQGKSAAADGSAKFEGCEVLAGSGPGQVVQGSDLFLITLGHAQAYCGEEDVYGKLCEEACLTSTDRPYIVEGLTLRASPLDDLPPLTGSAAVALSGVHLRSLVASAYFARERQQTPSLISRDGLTSAAWCLGARPAEGDGVPVALLARQGETTRFLDAWTARRERIEPPPRRYWAGVMAMRPWNVFLAHILQFQCQLRDLLLGAKGDDSGPIEVDPCADVRGVARDASKAMAELIAYYGEVSGRLAEFRTIAPNIRESDIPRIKSGLTELKALQNSLEATGKPSSAGSADRLLIRGGIVELPSAGYLPVVPGSSLTVNTQVRRLLGEGLDLRFCVVRPDYVAHALEAAQHMERISLLRGLDDPAQRAEVDVLVPDGEILDRPSEVAGLGFRSQLALGFGSGRDGTAPAMLVDGAGRGELLAAGGVAFSFAGGALAEPTTNFQPLVEAFARGSAETRRRSQRLLGERLSASPRVEAPLRPATRPDAELIRSLLASSAARSRAELGDESSTSVAFWLSLQWADDPFALLPGQTTLANVEAIFTTPAGADGQDVVGIDLQGRLNVRTAQGTDEDRVITGLISGSLLSRRWTGGPTPTVEGDRVTFEARLSRSRSSDGQSLVLLTLSDPTGRSQDRIQLSLTWQGRPWEFTGKADFLSDVRKAQPLARASLLEDADVLRPGSPYHTLALGALETIGRAIADPHFADASGALLFPAAPPATTTLEVRARRDWVLFHRRRTRTCNVEPERPAPTPSRRYAVYQASLADEETANAAQTALTEGRPLPEGVAFEQVDTVEFAAGRPTLSSDPEALREDWLASSPGDRITFAAIASVGSASADGDDLARLRTDRLLEALATVATIDAGDIIAVLDRPPPALSSAGTDGVIAVLTRITASTKTPCIATRWLTPGRRDEVDKLIASKLLDPLISPDASGRSLSVPLGTTRFEEGSEGFAGDVQPLVASWKDLSQGAPPADLAVFSRSGDEAAGPVDLRLKRAVVLARAFGGDIKEPRDVPIDRAIPGDCPVIVLIRPQATCHEVILLQPNRGEFPLANRLIEQRNLGELRKAPYARGPGHILFAPGTERVLDSDLEPTFGDQAATGQPVTTSTWFRKDDPRTKPADQFGVQVKEIVRRLRVENLANDPQPIVLEEPFSDDCPFVTVLLINPTAL